MSIPRLWQKVNFSGLGEERWTPRAIFLAPQTTNPPDIFEAVIYIHCPCPTRSELAVGCFYVEIEGLSSRELFLMAGSQFST